MKFIVLLCFFSCSFVANVICQEQPLPQLLVTENQDSLYGYLRRTSEVLHIQQGFYYKSSKTAEESLYIIENVKAFRDAKGKVYLKKLIPRVQSDSVIRFVEVLLVGEVSLYSYGNSFYVEKKDKIYKLKDTDSHKRNKGGELVRKQNKEYIATLSVLLGDCFELYPKIIKSNLDFQDLIPLMKEYHNCRGANYTIVAEYRKIKPVFDLGVFAGGFLASSTLNLTNDNSRIVSGLRDQNFIFGADLRFKFNALNTYYFILSPQLSLDNSYYHKTKSILNSTVIDNYELYYQFNQIDFPFGVGFDFPGEMIKPFISTGVTLSNFWKGSYQFFSSRTSSDGNQNNESILGDFKGVVPFDSSFGLWTAFGVKWQWINKKTFFSRIRYQASTLGASTGRVRNIAKKFNYHQFKIELGIIF